MKKILYILLIGLFASCDNLLDVEPETEVSFDNFYKTEQDLEITCGVSEGPGDKPVWGTLWKRHPLYCKHGTQ